MLGSLQDELMAVSLRTPYAIPTWLACRVSKIGCYTPLILLSPRGLFL